MPLKASLQNGEDPHCQTISLEADKDKKSAFWLSVQADEGKSYQSMKNDGSGCSLTFSETNGEVWFAGGFQVVSNCKVIEIYLQEKQGGQPEYLTTSRGIPSKDYEGLFKVLCAFPGGARPVYAVQLKMKSIQPKEDCGEFRLVSFKLTARLPAAPASAPVSSSTPDIIAPNSQTEEPTRKQPPRPPPNNNSLSNIEAQLAGLVFSFRSTEEKIVKRIENTSEKTCKSIEDYHSSMLSKMEEQSQLIQDQATALERMKELLGRQSSEIELLKEAVENLTSKDPGKQEDEETEGNEKEEAQEPTVVANDDGEDEASTSEPAIQHLATTG